VIVRAVKFIAVITKLASVNLIVQRMVLLFFPAMSALTAVLVPAPIYGIVLNECLHLPIGALFLIVII
jgi:hypothetical protein